VTFVTFGHVNRSRYLPRPASTFKQAVDNLHRDNPSVSNFLPCFLTLTLTLTLTHDSGGYRCLRRVQSVSFDDRVTIYAADNYDRPRRPASADRTARRQFQATGQPVSRTQATDAMTSRLPPYEAKCLQRRCFQCGSVPLRSDIKETELPAANILIPLERQLIALQLCRYNGFYIMKLCSRLFVIYCRNCPKDDKFR